MESDQPGQPNRLTVGQAADQLGISENAVRNRVKRGTLRSTRENGAVVVLLADADQPANQPASDTGQPSGQRETSANETREPPDSRDELISVLREQLNAEREAHAETRRIAAMLAGRARELESPESRQEPPQRDAHAEDGITAAGPSAEPYTASEDSEDRKENPEPRRSWWRRLLGG